MIPFTETEKKDPKTGMKPQKTQIAQAFLRKKKKAGGIIFPDVKLLLDYKTQNNMVSQSVNQFSRSVISNSLRPHELQHARPPCLSPTPGVHSNSRPLSR